MNIVLYILIAAYIVVCLFVSLLKTVWWPGTVWKPFARIVFFPCIVFDWAFSGIVGSEIVKKNKK